MERRMHADGREGEGCAADESSVKYDARSDGGDDDEVEVSGESLRGRFAGDVDVNAQDGSGRLREDGFVAGASIGVKGTRLSIRAR